MPESTPYAEILLSTYNGANYLEELLESVLAQSYNQWCLVIRDDGSTDKTVEILHRYRSDYPDRVKLITDDQMRLGAKDSFARLLSLSQAELVFLCDQDDVWHHDKMKIMIDRYSHILHDLKANHNTPILICSDLVIVDSAKNLLYRSFREKEKIFLEFTSDLYMTFFANFSPGCAMMLNRQLACISSTIPSEAVMHDWWISLSAILHGKVEIVPEKLVNYRIHQQNTIGIREDSSANPLFKLIKIISSKTKISSFMQNHRTAIDQAKAFCKTNGLYFRLLRYWSKVFQWYVNYYLLRKKRAAG